MTRSLSMWGVAFGSVAAAIATSPYSAAALTTAEINQIAQGITVRVDSPSPGSGVLIQRSGDTYTLLTTARVATSQAVTIITSSGQSHTASTIRRIPGFDVAVVQFQSSQRYPIATLGNSNQVTGKTFVAGYPLPTAALNDTVYAFTEGTMTANAKRPLQNGYALVYSNATQPGMIGGPVLDSNGRLVGIHGLNAASPPIQSINPELSIHTGFNVGLPLNLFLSWVSQTGLSLNLPALSPFPTLPPLAEDYFLRGGSYLQRGNIQGALADYTQAIRLKPAFAAAFASRQQLYFWQGNYQQSIADGNRAIQLQPSSNAYIVRGFARAKLGDLQGQLLDLNQAVALSPGSYAYRSYAHYQLGNYSQALADAEQAVQLNPESPFAYATRGMARSKLGQSEAALEDGSSAIQYDPDAVIGWFGRAVIYYNLQDHRSAIASINQALTRNSNFVEAYLLRAAARMRSGDQGGAIADLNQAITLDPNNAAVKRARRALGLQ